MKVDAGNSIRLGECGELRNGVNFNQSQEGFGLPVLKVKDFENHFFVPTDGLDELDITKVSTSSEQILEEGDTIIIRSNGNSQLVGRCLFAHSLKRPTIFSGFCIRFRPNPKVIVPRYASYVLRSPICRRRFVAFGSGTGIQNLNQATIANVELILPALDEQNAIARTLGALDDKIELNRQMNHTLEAMAQSIFKSWFVAFDPVAAKAAGRRFTEMNANTTDLFPSRFVESELGLIPEGWQVKPLDEVAHFLNGLALQKFPPTGDGDLPVIKIAEMRKGISDSSAWANSSVPAKYIVDDGDVLFSWSGTLDVCLWCGGKGALNQHLFKVTSADYPKWFYYLWNREHLPEFQAIASDKVTTMGHIQRHHLSNALVVIPSAEILSKADSIISPLLERVISNNIESRNLAALRDFLLPKLLSGEIRVNQAENVIGKAV